MKKLPNEVRGVLEDREETLRQRAAADLLAGLLDWVSHPEYLALELKRQTDGTYAVEASYRGVAEYRALYPLEGQALVAWHEAEDEKQAVRARLEDLIVSG